MMKFIKNFNVLINYQNDYMKGRSMERAIFQLLEEVTNILNDNVTWEKQKCVDWTRGNWETR